MVTISDNIYPKNTPSSSTTNSTEQPKSGAASSSQSLSYELLMNHLTMEKQSNTLDITSSAASISNPENSAHEGSGDDDVMNDFIQDIPLLVSDHEGFSDDDTNSTRSTQSHIKHFPHRHRHQSMQHEQSSTAATTPQPSQDKSDSFKPSDAAEQVKRSMRNGESTVTSLIKKKMDRAVEASSEDNKFSQELIKVTSSYVKTSSTTDAKACVSDVVTSDGLTAVEFRNERTQLMTIIVKYIATKIHNSFPPESPRLVKPNELPLDKFLLLLTSRLELTLTMFMKGIIYLFRYMDIIYLLRYLNQSNNFLNYNDMGFGLKKLIVACFKLALVREKKMVNIQNAKANKPEDDSLYEYNWSAITGLPNQEINDIVKRIVSRMNGKLSIKNIELIRMKSEIFRFVKMVANEV
ncbi:uncharacterized protein RJT20DRAFT_134444 [Scheffersomyces xylosifermentans]|uniref:uncharacterized protein n=1 Tax=Scheffersomyces xylosifermentans TaxID=1304137 RepID=UPI00315CC29D